MSENTIVSSDATLEVGGMYDMFLEEHHGVMERIVGIVELSVENIHHDHAEHPHSFD